MNFKTFIMESKFKFEKLIIWQKSMELGEIINEMAKSFTSSSVFRLRSSVQNSNKTIIK